MYWSWPLHWTKVKSKYAIRKPICDFIFDDTSNVRHTFYRLWDIHRQIVHALDPDLQNGTRSNVNMPTESFLLVGNSNVCSVCHRLRDIQSRNMYHVDLELWNESRSNVNMLTERPRSTAIAVLVESLIWTFQCNRFEYFTLTTIFKYVDDLDENWLANLHYQHAYVYKFGASRSGRLLTVYFVTNGRGRTDLRMNNRTYCLIG